jgi:hypothetical protein
MGDSRFYSHQFIDAEGMPYPGVKVYHYAAGTSTLKAVWYDADKTTAAPNPVTGDTRGMVAFYGDGNYRLVVTDANGLSLYDWPTVPIVAGDYFGTSVPAAGTGNVWQEFGLVDGSDNFLGKVIQTGGGFAPLTPGLWTNDTDITAITNREMILSSTVTLQGNTTVPATVSLRPMAPGIIIANGFTLTINGPVVGNPMHQWLSGFAAGDVTGLKKVKEEWFGTIPLAISTGVDVELQKGDYPLASVISLATDGQALTGAGLTALQNQGTRIILGYDDDAINLGGLFSTVENFCLDCNSKNGHGFYANNNYNTIRRVQVKNVKTGKWAFYLYASTHNDYYSVYMIDCQNGINLVGTGGSGSFSSFYACSVLSDNGLMETAITLNSAGTTTIFAVNFYNLLIGAGVGKALAVNNVCGSVIDGIYLEAAFLNTTDLITIVGANTNGYFIKHGVISQQHASFAQVFVRASGGGKNIGFEGINFIKVSSDTSDIINLAGMIGVSIKNCDLNAPAGSYFLSDDATTEGITVENFRSKNTTTIALSGFKHHITGGSSNTTISVIATANEITIENFPGTITIDPSALHIVLINCTGSITDTGKVATRLGAQAAANADTSGATLGNLEIEVNQLKQLLRDAGLLAT